MVFTNDQIDQIDQTFPILMIFSKPFAIPLLWRSNPLCSSHFDLPMTLLIPHVIHNPPSIRSLGLTILGKRHSVMFLSVMEMSFDITFDPILHSFVFPPHTSHTRSLPAQYRIFKALQIWLLVFKKSITYFCYYFFKVYFKIRPHELSKILMKSSDFVTWRMQIHSPCWCVCLLFSRTFEFSMWRSFLSFSLACLLGFFLILFTTILTHFTQLVLFFFPVYSPHQPKLFPFPYSHSIHSIKQHPQSPTNSFLCKLTLGPQLDNIINSNILLLIFTFNSSSFELIQDYLPTLASTLVYNVSTQINSLQPYGMSFYNTINLKSSTCTTFG